MDITMIGLQNAGKTSLLRVLAVSRYPSLRTPNPAIPTPEVCFGGLMINLNLLCREESLLSSTSTSLDVRTAHTNISGSSAPSPQLALT